MVIFPNAPPELRLKVSLIVLALAAIGAVLIWLGLAALLPLIRALSGGADLVAFAPRDLLPLPLSIMFLALAGLPFCAMPAGGTKKDRRRTRTATKRAFNPAYALLTAAVAGALLTIAIIPVSRMVVAGMVARRGYQPCPAAQEWERHAPLRWIRAGGRCP